MNNYNIMLFFRLFILKVIFGRIRYFKPLFRRRRMA